MGFSAFHGNAELVTRIREMLGRDRLPHAIILAGPRGSGKFTLAQMLAKAMNCLSPLPSDLPDFCGTCENCRRIAEADDFETRFAEAVEAREGLREADKRETRIFVQSHPDVLIIPPDPPQMMIKVDQVRRVIESIYFRPIEGRERVYIFTDSAFMKEAANALLKVLEEPPQFATLFLLSENSGELLPTIRSRSVTFTLAPLTPDEIERFLEQRQSKLMSKQRRLIARLCGGGVGRALTFDIESYVAVRSDALVMLRTAVHSSDHSDLFRTTEGYRPGAEGREKIEALIRTLYSLLEDLMFIKSAAPELVTNSDISTELGRMASTINFEWIATASERLADVERGLRRNLLRSLSLDSFVAAVER
jgi:DNA polymerase-3 subunit delta'